jgi:hypothetical protein
VHIYHSVNYLLAKRIESIQELFSRKEPPRRIHQQLKQLEFGWSEDNAAIIDRDFVFMSIQHEPSDV